MPNNIPSPEEVLGKKKKIPTPDEVLGTVKKKEATVSASDDTSLDTQQVETPKQSGSSALDKTFTDKSGKKYKLDESGNAPVWMEYSYSNPSGSGNVDVFDTPVNDPSVVSSLNKNSGMKASTSQFEEVFTNYPGKETNEYRIVDNNWQRRQKGEEDWTEIRNKGSVDGLNKQYGKDVGFSKYRDAVVDEVGAKEVSDRKTLNESLSVISEDFIGKTEEDAKKILKEKFPEFTFEEQGLLAVDKIKVIAPGRVAEKTFSFDENSEDVAKDLKEFLKIYSNKEFTDSRRELNDAVSEKANVGKHGMYQDNYDPLSMLIEDKFEKEALDVTIEEKSQDYLAQYNKEALKVLTTKDLEKKKYALANLPKDDMTSKVISEQNKNLATNYKEYKAKEEELTSEANSIQERINRGEITLEQGQQIITEKQSELQAIGEKVTEDVAKSTSNMAAIHKSMASNQLINEERGSVSEGMVKSFVKGLTSFSRLALSEEQQEKMLTDVFGFDTTAEFTNSEKRNDFTKSMFSLMESLGTGATGGAVAGGTGVAANFFVSSYYELKDELDTVEGISENEKMVMASTYGLISAGLERVGLGAMLNKTKAGNALIKNVAARFIKDLPKNASKETIEFAINRSVKSMMADYGLKTGRAMLTEGVTESLQAASGELVKQTYDQLKDVDYFENREVSDLVKDWAYEGLLASYGAGMMSGLSSTYNAAKNGYLEKVSDNNFAAGLEIVSDPIQLRNAKLEINEKLKGGIYTQEEAKSAVEALDGFKAAVEKVPSEMGVRDKKKAVDLITKRDFLEQEISGKDESLGYVVSRKEEIKKINEKLNVLGQTEEVVDITEEQIDALNDDEQIELSYTSEESIPEFLKPLAEKGLSGTAKKGLFGKTNEVQIYKVNATGKQIKDLYYAIQEQTTDEGVLQPEQSEVGLQEMEQGNEEQEVTAQEGQQEEVEKSIEEKIKVFRGKGNNFSEGINEGMVWVAEDESVAKNYASINDDGSFNVEEKEILKPKNAFELPYKFNTDVRSSNIGDNLRNATKIAMDEGVISKDEVSDVLDMIDNYEKEAGDNLEPYHTKINKPEASRFFSDILLKLNYDSVLIKEGGSNTYGLITQPVQQIESFIATEQEVDSTIDQVKQYKGQKALDWLDNFESKLDEITDPKNFNDATRVIPAMALKAIVKAVRLSLEAGMSVSQAIDAYINSDNKYSKEDITNALFTKPATTNRPAKQATKSIAKKDDKTVTVNEQQALKSQIRLEAKAAKDGFKAGIAKLREFKADQSGKKKALKQLIDDILKSAPGKKVLNSKAVVRRLMRVNINNDISVKQTAEYLEKAFNDAAYVDRINKLNKLKRSNLKKAKGKAITIKNLAKKLKTFDPVLVSDLDAYENALNEIAGAVKAGEKETADIQKLQEYAETEGEILRKKAFEMKMVNYKNALEEAGIDYSNMSNNEIIEARENIKKDPKDTIAELRDDLEVRTESLKEAIKESDNSNNKAVMKKIFDMDISKLSALDLRNLIDGIDNFIDNDIVDGVSSIIDKAIGKTKATTFSKMGIKPISWGNWGTRYMAEQFSSIPVLANQVFGGSTNAVKFLDSLGYFEMDHQANLAKRISKKIDEEYLKKFGKSKPNGGDFFSVENIYERALIADMLRTNNEEGDFARKRKLLVESIEELKKGDEKERKKGKYYEEVFEKTGLDNANSVDDLNIDPKNREAVDFWINKWAEIYTDLRDLNLSLYNLELDNEDNYTHKRMSKLKNASIKEDRDSEIQDMSAYAFDSGNIVKGQAGVLKENTRPETISDRYVDLDFDISQSRALLAAMIDIKTSNTAAQMKSFLDSSEFSSMFRGRPQEAKLVADRVRGYVNTIRMKSSYDIGTSDKEIKEISNRIAGIGTRIALGGILALPKQTIPVFANTLINVGPANMVFVGPQSKGMNDWMKKHDLSIIDRGMESRSTYEKADELLSKSKGRGVSEKVGDALNKAFLETFLGNGDVYAARSSFMSYYIKSLRKQGLIKGAKHLSVLGKATNAESFIDWDNHKPNKEALQYAKFMIDNQQNVSDTSGAGKAYTSQKLLTVMARKTIMSFTSFVINSKAKLWANYRTAFLSPYASIQDRAEAVRSIAATAAEIAIFSFVGAYLKDSIKSLYSGEEPDEEEKSKQEKYTKERIAKNFITDFISINPLADDLTLMGVNSVYKAINGWMFDENDEDYKKELNEYKEENKDKFDKFNDKAKQVELDDFKEKYIERNSLNLTNNFKKGELDNFGAMGIGAKMGVDIVEAFGRYNKGYMEVENPYTGGTTKKFYTEEAKKDVLDVALLKGLNYVITDQAFGYFIRAKEKEVKKSTLNKSQYKEYLELDEKATPNEVKLIKDKYSADDIKRFREKTSNKKVWDVFTEAVASGETRRLALTNYIIRLIEDEGYTAEKLIEKYKKK